MAIRLGLGPGGNIYLKAGLALLALALACLLWTWLAWPLAGRDRFLAMWGIRGGFLGGLVFYAIGRFVQLTHRRAQG